ncbi:uncharacterized protein LOC132281672 [Cornus florida]|uniref:uncharacterized protein LOC132281672 n=1 Tax=Cornus florida TaxID=4283 RepID=UPI0028A1DEE1|nr:uncharacterized protein LOC132281672 [Cornus florida]
MEEKPWAKYLAETINFLEKTLSRLSSHPLFSSIVTLCTLILLYFPSHFLQIVFSPVLISTAILLLTLLRLAAFQRIQKEFNSIQPQQTLDLFRGDHKWVESCETSSEFNTATGLGLGFDLDPNPFYADSFVEWNLRAPLEVIYEDYEGEEDDEERDDVWKEKEDTCFMGIERYNSLSLYYPESDTDSSSDGGFPAMGSWELPESMCFRWDEEDRDGLIEIQLDGKRTSGVFHVEEDNLIEIDISPSRTPARNGPFAGKG